MRTEQQALRVSFVAILAFSALGIGFGLVSGSSALVFDGVVSLVDAAMSMVSIVVAGLIARSTTDGLAPRITRRFTMGFWHFEPMVLAVNALLLLVVSSYAVIQSAAALLAGGREVEFGPAVAYAAIVLALTTTVGLLEWRANRRIGSALVAMDVKGWLVSGAVTGALLVAFAIALVLEGTSLAWMLPYVDPAVLMIVALVLLPVPIPTLRRAVAQIALVAPRELQDEAEGVGREVVEREAFDDVEVIVAQVGRARQIEMLFLVPRGRPARPLEEGDRVRSEVFDRLRHGPDDWITVLFTTRRDDDPARSPHPDTAETAADRDDDHDHDHDAGPTAGPQADDDPVIGSPRPA